MNMPEDQLESIKRYMDHEDLEFYSMLQKVKINEAGMSMETCIICYSNQITIFEKPLECGHRFHAECIKEWLKYQKKCPYCKREVADH